MLCWFHSFWSILFSLLQCECLPCVIGCLQSVTGCVLWLDPDCLPKFSCTVSWAFGMWSNKGCSTADRHLGVNFGSKRWVTEGVIWKFTSAIQAPWFSLLPVATMWSVSSVAGSSAMLVLPWSLLNRVRNFWTVSQLNISFMLWISDAVSLRKVTKAHIFDVCFYLYYLAVLLCASHFEIFKKSKC